MSRCHQSYVVGVDVADVLGAGRATAIAFCEREALRTGEESRGAAEIERHAVAAQHSRDEFGVSRHAPGGARRGSAVRVRRCARGRSIEQCLEVQAHDDGGLGERRQRRSCNPRAWRASIASASVWICGIVRTSSTPGPAAPAIGIRPGTGARTAARASGFTPAEHVADERLDRGLDRCGGLGVEPSIQVNHAIACSRIVSERVAAEQLFAGLDAFGSSRASASRTPRIRVSSGHLLAPGPRTRLSRRSASPGSARSATRSSIAVIAAAASTLIAAASSAAATCGCFDAHPLAAECRRSAVATPTAISFAASPRVDPVEAAIIRTGLWKPCALASPISPNSRPRASRDLSGDPRQQRPRRHDALCASRSVTRTRPANHSSARPRLELCRRPYRRRVANRPTPRAAHRGLARARERVQRLLHASILYPPTDIRLAMEIPIPDQQF